MQLPAAVPEIVTVVCLLYTVCCSPGHDALYTTLSCSGLKWRPAAVPFLGTFVCLVAVRAFVTCMPYVTCSMSGYMRVVQRYALCHMQSVVAQVMMRTVTCALSPAAR